MTSTKAATTPGEKQGRPERGGRGGNTWRNSRALVWSVVDQGLVSLTHFGLNLMLIRLVGGTDYGTFAVMFMVLAILLEAQQYLVLAPMSILGPTTYRDRLVEYVRKVRRAQLGTVVLTATAVAITGLVVGEGEARNSLWALAFTQVFVLAFFVERRLCQILGKQALSAWWSLCYLALSLTGVAVAERHVSLTASIAMAWLGASAAVSCIGVKLGLRGVLVSRGSECQPAVETSEVLNCHAKQAAWTLPAAILNAVLYQGQVGLAGAVAGLTGAGGMRAAITLAMPVGQFSAALNSYYLPRLSAAWLQGRASFANTKLHYGIATVGATVAYALIAAQIRDPIYRTIYAGNYWEFRGLFPLLAATSIPMGLITVQQAALQVEGRFSRILGAAIAGFAVAAPLMALAATAGSPAFVVCAVLAGYVAYAIATFNIFCWGVPAKCPRAMRTTEDARP